MAKEQMGTWEPSRVRRREHTACRQPRHVWFACSSVKSDGQTVYHAFSNAVVRETTVTENPQLTLRLLRSVGAVEREFWSLTGEFWSLEFLATL